MDNKKLLLITDDQNVEKLINTHSESYQITTCDNKQLNSQILIENNPLFLKTFLKSQENPCS